MKFQKYKKALTVYFVYVVLVSIFVIFALITSGGEMSPVVPGDNMGIEIAVIYLIMFTLGAIIGILLGYVFGPIFLFAQKKIIGRKMVYGIQDRPKETEFKKIIRAFFPALMSLNFAMLLASSPAVENLIAPTTKSVTATNPIVVIVMLMFTVIISFALFAGAWFLIDSGLMYTNRDKDAESDKPIETRSVGGLFLNLLHGYAGISVAIGFYELAVYQLPQQTNFGDMFGVIALLFPVPIFIMIAAIPGVIFLDMFRNQRNFYMRNVAKIYGIRDQLESTWEIKKNE
jgi:hypothetical protein